jgi:queuosine precursor transporter
MPHTPVPAVLAMATVVVASNILVQFLAGPWLTWGAFTYPLVFLVTDLTTRLHGPAAARRVVLAGFAAGLACSLIGSQIEGPAGPLVSFRVAVGSGLAFLCANLLDIAVFQRLRRQVWWRAPLLASVAASMLDTAIFFTVAFSAALAFLDPGADLGWAAEPLPLLGLGPPVPLWVSLAVADGGVKLLLDLVALLPFRLIVAKLIAPVAE